MIIIIVYHNKNNNFFHGIMLHHFHDDRIHEKGQGSISKDEFYKLIKFVGKKNILDADIFFDKFTKHKLKNNDVCLTFDDGIKCQIDIALPVLEDLKIKSFFFPYTSIFEGKPDNLEVYRYFRLNYFNDISDFYNHFFSIIEKNLDSFFDKNKKIINETKLKFPFYSTEDVKFRLVRDKLLNKDDYENIMSLMMKIKNFEPKEFYSKLFFSKKDLKELDKLGHIVGLHSHSHPTLIEKLTYNEQKKEYEKSNSIISKITNKLTSNIKCMSHPCGSYNGETLTILKKMNIQLGFKQIMSVEPEKGMSKINNSFLEIARQDHAEIIKRVDYDK
jgi:peptidoglycan/xylan/chitin deacetylase (PgdA/CDA1 family)